MSLIYFIIWISVAYGMILWSEMYVKEDLRYLKILLIIFGYIPVINIVLLLIINYYFFISYLLKFEILEYVEN